MGGIRGGSEVDGVSDDMMNGEVTGQSGYKDKRKEKKSESL
jgi:hypothetical protein